MKEEQRQSNRFSERKKIFLNENSYEDQYRLAAKIRSL